MRYVITLLIISLLLLPLSKEIFGKTIPIRQVKIEFYAKSLHRDKLPVLSRAVLMYLRNTYMLQNKFVAARGNDPKNILRIKFLRYNKGVSADISIGRGRKEPVKITVFEDRIRYFESLTDQEKKLRGDIKRLFRRENFTETEVNNYMLFTLFICDAIDKTV